MHVLCPDLHNAACALSGPQQRSAKASTLHDVGPCTATLADCHECTVSELCCLRTQVFDPASNTISANTQLAQLVATNPINLYPYVRSSASFELCLACGWRAECFLAAGSLLDAVLQQCGWLRAVILAFDCSQHYGAGDGPAVGQHHDPGGQQHRAVQLQQQQPVAHAPQHCGSPDAPPHHVRICSRFLAGSESCWFWSFCGSTWVSLSSCRSTMLHAGSSHTTPVPAARSDLICA